MTYRVCIYIHCHKPDAGKYQRNIFGATAKIEGTHERLKSQRANNKIFLN